jgi:flavodoxin
MKVLVAYRSQSGNTQKIAEAIYGAISEQKEIKRTEEVNSLEGYDLAFLGFTIYALGPDEPVVNFLKSHVKDKTIALFITHASPEGAPPLQGWIQKFKDAAASANIVDVFNCQGALSQQVKAVMLNHSDPQLRAWAQNDNSQGQPDAARIERARVFAKETIEKVQS